MKRFLSWLLVAVICIGLFSFVTAEGNNGKDGIIFTEKTGNTENKEKEQSVDGLQEREAPTIKTPVQEKPSETIAPLEKPSEDDFSEEDVLEGMEEVDFSQFQNIDILPEEYEKIVPQNYIPVFLNNYFDAQVFGFVNPKGEAEFRIYAGKDGNNGFYEAVVTPVKGKNASGKEEVQFTVIINEQKGIITDQEENFGVPSKIANAKGSKLPKGGYDQVGKTKGFYIFNNLFGKQEYRKYASYDKKNYSMYKANAQGEIIPGTFELVMADDVKSKAKGGTTLEMIEDLAKGWKQQMIAVIDGKRYVIETSYPDLEATLQREGIEYNIPAVKAPSQQSSNKGNSDKKPSSGGTLKLGREGNDVFNFTEKLVQLGYLSGTSKVYNDTVKNAVKNFQKINGLKVDGIAGSNTIAKVNGLLTATPTPPPVVTATPPPAVTATPIPTPTPIESESPVPAPPVEEPKEDNKGKEETGSKPDTGTDNKETNNKTTP